jgi:hypothetical protein
MKNESISVEEEAPILTTDFVAKAAELAEEGCGCGFQADDEFEWIAHVEKCPTANPSIVEVVSIPPTPIRRRRLVREGGGSLAILDNEGRQVAELSSEYFDSRTGTVRRWTDSEIAANAQLLTK